MADKGAARALDYTLRRVVPTTCINSLFILCTSQHINTTTPTTTTTFTRALRGVPEIFEPSSAQSERALFINVVIKASDTRQQWVASTIRRRTSSWRRESFERSLERARIYKPIVVVVVVVRTQWLTRRPEEESNREQRKDPVVLYAYANYNIYCLHGVTDAQKDKHTT